MLRPLTRRFLTYRFTDSHALNKACIQQPPAGSNSTLKLDFDLFRRTANATSNSSSVFPSAGHNRHNLPAGDSICKPHNRSSNHQSRQQINRHRRGRRRRRRRPHSAVVAILLFQTPRPTQTHPARSRSTCQNRSRIRGKRKAWLHWHHGGINSATIRC